MLNYNVATSKNLSIAENALIINPTANLAGSTHYYLALEPGSVNNLAGSSYDSTTNGPIVEIETLFADDFSSSLNPANWDYNHWVDDSTGAFNPSFYGRTQQRQELPGVSDGELHLKLDTFNPSYDPADPKQVPSFYGSEAITKQSFSNYAGGVVFEIKAHFVDPVGGLVGGMFSYANNSGNLHDEIDFEAVSNKPDQIQTNIYDNEPLGAGHPQCNPIEGVVTQDHLYRIEWFQNAIRWFVDGQLIRVETDYIPQNAMALHLNIWAPGKEWIEGFNDALNPVKTAGENVTYYFDIDSVRVAQLSSTVVDITPPEVTTFTPADAATGVSASSNIVLTFSEAIQKGTGLIEIHSGSATGTVVESYDVAASSLLSIGGNTLTINPSAVLAYNTNYYVTVGANAIKDLAGNSYAGTTAYDFITEVVSSGHNLTGSVTFWRTGAAIAGVTSTLSRVPATPGTQPVESDSMTTGADGRYQHIDMPDGTYALTNDKVASTADKGAVDLLDAITILKGIVGLTTLNPNQEIAADFDNSKDVDLNDAIGILKHVVGLPAPTPEFVFVNQEAAPVVPFIVDLTADTTVDLVGILRGDVDGSWGV